MERKKLNFFIIKYMCTKLDVKTCLQKLYVIFNVLGISLQVAVCVVMLLWIPRSDQAYISYILAAAWGIGDAANEPLSMGN